MVRGIRVMIFSAITVLVLWWFMGFILPSFFPSLEESGAWGDGFGSVTSLFSGLGFLALVFTIYLQIQSQDFASRQGDFSIYLKILDDIRREIENLEYDGHKGIACIGRIEALLNEQNFLNIRANFELHVRVLWSINEQLVLLIEMLDQNKTLSFGERQIIRHKVVMMHTSYLFTINDSIIRSRIDDEAYDALRHSSEEVNKGVHKMIEEFFQD